MHKLLFLLLPIFCCLACEKDKTLADRLLGTWKSSKVQQNGTDNTAVYSYQIALRTGGEMEETIQSKLPVPSAVTKPGTWSANDADQTLSITTDGNPILWTVKHLDANLLVLERSEAGTAFIIDFIKIN